MEQFTQILTQLTEGFGNTLLLFAITLLGAIPLGLLFAVGSLSAFKPLQYLVKGIIWVIRGTPLMLQILLVSFLPMALGLKTKDIAAFFDIRVGAVLFWFVVVAFVINYACYFSEIYRAGIQSIPLGQYEAGTVLGLTKGEIFFKIILVQALKRIFPPMSNEIITLVKDTALAQILGVVDLLNAANHAVNEFVDLTPLLYASIFYLIFNGLLTLLFSYVEKEFEWFKV